MSVDDGIRPPGGGLDAAAADVPHAPTVGPEDPAGLAVAIAQLANALWLGTGTSGGPASGAAPASALAASPPTAATPALVPLAIDTTQLFQPTEPTIAPAPGAPTAPTEPTEPGDPFSSPLVLDHLLDHGGPTFAPPLPIDLDLGLVPTIPAVSVGPTSAPTSPPANPAGGSAIPVAGVPTRGLPTEAGDPIVAPSPGDAAHLAFALPAPTLASPVALVVPDAPDSTAAPSIPKLDVPATFARPELVAMIPATLRAPRTDADGSHQAFDPEVVRADFPILNERVHTGKRLVWLDNAATTQKPRAVIDRLTYFYEHENSNIHRAAHTLAARATDAYENARETVRRFLNAPTAGEIVFVRGTTEGINLLATTLGRQRVGAGDEIVITHLEHHANIVPWQQLCAATGARLVVAPVDDTGQIVLDAYARCFTPRTKLASITQVSNALGTITPARRMIEIAHAHGVPVVLDGAQAVSHLRVDVQHLDCDFYVFSGHKVFGPTGIGAVYGKRAWLDELPPWQGGGNMIADVTFERTVYQPPPFRFEAGTGNIADAVGLGAALDYVMRIGMDVIDRYEHELLVYATAELARVRGLTLIGTAETKAGVLSFVLDGKRTQDLGAVLDRDGIAVRSGHHCAQPILRRFGVEATVRASLALYNTRADIDALVDALHRIQASQPIEIA